MTDMVAGVADCVVEVLDRYVTAWSERDLQSVADLWDDEGAPVSYVGEELGEVLLDRERITEHLLRTEYRVTSARVSLSELHVQELTPDLALATFVCRWELEWVSYSRVSALLRNGSSGWRFVHYMEAPFHLEDRK